MGVVPAWFAKPVILTECYLGEVLPAAVFGLLVVYCLRDVGWTQGWHGAPELISILVVVALHLWRRQMLLSIAGGTICYMLLVQLVFVYIAPRNPRALIRRSTIPICL